MRADGRKDRDALTDGYRESTESWRFRSRLTAGRGRPDENQAPANLSPTAAVSGQEFILHRIWRHVEATAVSVNITAYWVPACNACA